MNPVTQEWVEKAEADFHGALRELRARKHRSLDAICFHAQQCAEKYLEARLQEAGIAFPKTHKRRSQASTGGLPRGAARGPTRLRITHLRRAAREASRGDFVRRRRCLCFHDPGINLPRE